MQMNTKTKGGILKLRSMQFVDSKGNVIGEVKDILAKNSFCDEEMSFK